eukprot:35476-Pleurochrysis_carterae.AAC.3
MLPTNRYVAPVAPRRVATCAASAMATSIVATLGVSTPTHRPPGRHAPGSSVRRAIDMSRPVAGRHAAGKLAPAREAVGSCRDSHHLVHPSATT